MKNFGFAGSRNMAFQAGEDVPRFETLEIWIAWAQQYALMSLALGGIVGCAAWVWGAISANPERQSFGQMTLVLMCGSALALGLAPEIVRIFSSADL